MSINFIKIAKMKNGILRPNSKGGEMRKLASVLILWAVSLQAWSQTPIPSPTSETQAVTELSAVPESSFNWRQTSDTDGILLYSSEVPGTKIMALKGDGLIEAPMAKVATVIVDTTRGTEWIDSLLESKVLRAFGPFEFSEYDHMGIPFPFNQFISDRDFVSHVTVETDSLNQHVTVKYTPLIDPLSPVKKNFKRGVMTCTFSMYEVCPDETYLEAEIHCDPKGGLAAWLVNWFQGGWPETTFESLRREVARPDIKVIPFVVTLLGLPDNPEIQTVSNKK